MLKLFIFGCCIALIILLTSKKPALVKSRFHGYWNGSCNYHENKITWNILINDDGHINGHAIMNIDKQFDLVGKAESNGYCLLAGMLDDQKFQFEGSINEISAFGTLSVNGTEKGEWNAYKS